VFTSYGKNDMGGSVEPIQKERVSGAQDGGSIVTGLASQ
jgi:hypothetical protein